MKTSRRSSGLFHVRIVLASALFVLGAGTFSIAVLGAGQGGVAASPREHLFVGFTKTPGAAERALVERYSGTVRFSFPTVNALAIDLDRAKIGNLAREAGVSYVEQDPERVPLDLNDLETSQLVPDISNGLYGLVTTNAVDAHAAGYTGDGVNACVADTGLDTHHPDIETNFVEGKDIFSGTNSVDVFDLGVARTETHATHVSGILLGVDNTKGILGVAPAAKLYEARVLGGDPVSGTTSQLMAGVQWLAEEKGCKVINLSLGGGRKSHTEEALYKQITANGTLIVAAAGNAGGTKIDYPAAYATVMSVGAVDVNNNHASFSNTGHRLDISAPGVEVLSSVPNGQGRDAFVTAGTNTFAAFGFEFAGTTTTSGITHTLIDCGLGDSPSAFPPAVSGNIALIQRGSVFLATKVANAMAAEAVGAIIYNNVAGNFSGTLGTEDNNGTPWIPAVSVSQADGETLLIEFVTGTVTLVNAPTRWAFFDGTSMAAPHVAGVAALVLSKNPTLSPDEVRTILNSTATDLGAVGYDRTFGNGLVNATAALNATPLAP
jgi:subtilisin family serine protease